MNTKPFILITLICPECGAEFKRTPGKVNEAAKKGYRMYCGRACVGVSQRGEDVSPQVSAARLLEDAWRGVRA